MSTINATIEGVGFWTRGLPNWDAARQFAQGSAGLIDTPSKPAPQILAANERRRAPESVAVALEVAMAACTAAGRQPTDLPSIFTSTHGELSITDYMCATLASDPRAISPTKFHNSVHNAAAGYWTIGTGCMQAATAISSYDASFAQGLIEALAQLQAGAPAVLLVAYDAYGVGPLAPISSTDGLLGAALVLSRSGRGPQIGVDWQSGQATTVDRPLSRHAAANAMAPMLPLFDAIAVQASQATIKAGPDVVLRIALSYE